MDLFYLEKKSLFPLREEEGLGTNSSRTLGHIKVSIYGNAYTDLASIKTLNSR